MSASHASSADCSKIVAVLWVVICALNVSFADEDIHIRIERVNARISASPDDYQLYVKRGELHRLHEDFDAALTDYAEAEDKGPPEFHTTVYFFRGRLLYEAGQPAEAKAALDRFLAAHPNHQPGRLVRADVNERLGHLDAAIRDLSAAIAMQERPKPDLYLDRARLLASDKVNRPNESLQGIDEGIAQFGPLVALIQFVVELEARHGNFDAAIKYIDTLPQRLKQQPVWLDRRAQLLQSAGRVEEAHQFYREALAAIVELPPGRRRVRANVILESDLRQSIDRLAASETGSDLAR